MAKYDNHSYPYIVLIGDVGVGKSTLVEKLTGQTGLSSAAANSVTKTSRQFRTSDESILICDTPGCNPMKNRFQHNMQIAHAMNLYPVSCILIVVKADTRIDKVIDEVKKYTESFIDLCDILAICVTHMDTVEWEKKEFKTNLKIEFGFIKAVFTGANVPTNSVLNEIKETCGRLVDLTITSENFLKFFKISNNNFKILKSTKREVTEMNSIKKQFFKEFEKCSKKEKIDLIFEFQAWITEEITKAQMRVYEENDFCSLDSDMTSEAGHIANMTNQLRTVLLDVRTKLLEYQGEHGVSDLRKCPGCFRIWAKLQGCDGTTTCGNRMKNDFDSRRGIMFTFTFTRKRDKLSITRTGQRTMKAVAERDEFEGCGRTIVWHDMVPVVVPKDFSVTKNADTEDVKLLPDVAQKTFIEAFNNEMASISATHPCTREDVFGTD